MKTLKKLIAILFMLTMLAVVLVPPVKAQDIEAWVTLDKMAYEPGQQGTISITVRNTGDDPIEVKNLTIVFKDWMLYTEDGWDSLGNMTVIYSPAIIITSNSSVALDAITFTVPNDARGDSTEVNLSIYTNKGRLPSYYIMGWDHFIDVVDYYQLRYLRALDNIVLLLTVVAILAIVSAVIVAAAVFLSGRRPGVTWQKEG